MCIRDSDCTFPHLLHVIGTSDLEEAFRDVDVAFLVGSFPKKPSTKLVDYFQRNASIYSEHGRALSDFAKPTVKVLVIGMPTNTNALVAMTAAVNLSPKNFCAMTRLDHNRAVYSIAQKLGVHHSKVYKVVIWGNRSSSQIPDVSNAEYQDETGRHHILSLIHI